MRLSLTPIIFVLALLLVSSCNDSPAGNVVKISFSNFQLGNPDTQRETTRLESPRLAGLVDELQPEIIESLLVGYIPAVEINRFVEVDHRFEPWALAGLLVANYDKLVTVNLPTSNLVRSVPAPREESILVVYGTRVEIEGSESIKTEPGFQASTIIWGGFASDTSGRIAKRSFEELTGLVEITIYPLFCDSADIADRPKNSCPINKIISFEGYEGNGRINTITSLGNKALDGGPITREKSERSIRVSPFGTTLSFTGAIQGTLNFKPRDVYASSCYVDGRSVEISGVSITCDLDADNDLIGDSVDADDNNNNLIEISTYEELLAIDNAYASAEGCENQCLGYELVANIDVPSTKRWIPIATYSGKLTGAKVGGGEYYISGLNYQGDSGDVLEKTRVGLIGELTRTGTVEYLLIKQVVISPTSSDLPVPFYIGTVAGTNNGTIKNVRVSGVNIKLNSVTGRTYYAGGIAGRNNLKILNSSFDNITITGANSSTDYTSDVVGWNGDNATIEDTTETVGLTDVDSDNDNIIDRDDLDDDNDGLIEIYNSNLLNSIPKSGADGSGIMVAGVLSNKGCPSSGCIGYELTADIYTSREQTWIPISSYSGILTGLKADGGRYSISGLDYEYSPIDGIDIERSRIGLIGELTGEVKSLDIKGFRISSSGEAYQESEFYLGAVAAINSGTIDKVRVSLATITIPSVTGRTYYAGGIAGKNESSILNSSINNITITGASSTDSTGDVVGWLSPTGSIDSNTNGTVGRTDIDTDQDDVIDANDLDVDGNNLIEIYDRSDLFSIPKTTADGTGIRVDGILKSTGCATCNGYELKNNIDLSKITWVPINNLTGIFDGNSYQIVGLETDVRELGDTARTTEEKESVGFILNIASGAIVRDLVFQRAEIDALNMSGSNSVYAGVLATNNAGTISNVTVASSKINSGTIPEREYYLGGLVAINSGTINNSTVDIVFTAGNSQVTQYVGGLAAKNNAIIKGNSVTNIASTGFAKAGSLVGWNATAGKVTDNTYQQGTTSIGTNDGTASGNSQIK